MMTYKNELAVIKVELKYIKNWLYFITVLVAGQFGIQIIPM